MNQQDQKDTTPVDQRTVDLLNASIDGEISAAEQDELDRFMLGSESVRKLDRELRAVTDLLNDLPVLEPPAYLQSAIERQVRLPAGDTAHRKPAGFFAWLDSSRLRTGLALAAGVVLTISVYEMGSNPISKGDTNHMTGTIIKHGRTVQDGRVLDNVRIDTERMSGLVELRNDNDLFTVDVQLNSEVPVELVMNIAGRGLDVEETSNTSNPEGAVSIDDGNIRLASNGENLFMVKLRRTSDVQSNDPIELDFFAENRLVKKAELNIERR